MWKGLGVIEEDCASITYLLKILPPVPEKFVHHAHGMDWMYNMHRMDWMFNTYGRD